MLKAVLVAIRGSRYCIQISHKIDLDSVGRARNSEKALKGFATAAHSTTSASKLLSVVAEREFESRLEVPTNSQWLKY